MYKIVVMAIVAGIALGVATGFSLGSSQIEGMLAGVAALSFIAIPAAVVYANEKKKFNRAH